MNPTLTDRTKPGSSGTTPCLGHPSPPRTRRLAALVLILAAPSALAAPGSRTWCADRCDQVVIDWNLRTYEVVKTDNGYQNPMSASRTLAMVHLAMHDAVNAVAPRYQTYAYRPEPGSIETGADPVVAAAVAAHDVLAGLYPRQKEALDRALDASVLDAGVGTAVERARKVGAAAAAAMLARRANDGSQAEEAYTPGTRPGEYRFVPGTSSIAAPQWRAVTPFTMRSPDQFRVAPPPALDSARYAADFNEVKATGSKAAGARRSADQTEYASYWYEFSDIGWNRIARVVSRDHEQDLWERARTFALLNAVIADGYIAGWDSKMHYNLWRPVTAIQQAADDGNPATSPDAAWAPLLPTPPIMDYPSTHSSLGAAAAAVLAYAFGDRVSFTMASPSALPTAPARNLTSFSAAARENADSRVRAGIHFRFATAAGLEQGEEIGQQAIHDLLNPLPKMAKASR